MISAKMRKPLSSSKNLIIFKKTLVWLFLLSLLGCNTAKENGLGKKYFEAIDISYGLNSENKMDVYLPTNKPGPYPVMFLVHGGAWHWADKSDMALSAKDYQSKGFAVININYRMGDMEYTLEEKLEDIDSALSYAYKRQKQWNLSDDLSIEGGSAGGHMVLQYGFTKGLDKVDRIISFCGPTDLSNPFYKSESNDLYKSIYALFESWNPSIEELKQASPLYSIPDNPGPSVIMVHGSADSVVDYNDSLRLHQALLNGGWDSTLIEMPGIDHDFAGVHWDNVYEKFTPWLYSRVWP